MNLFLLRETLGMAGRALVANRRHVRLKFGGQCLLFADGP